VSRARGSLVPPGGGPAPAPPPPAVEVVVRAFATVARRFCQLVAAEPPAEPRARARKLNLAASELYAAALMLTALEIPDELAAEQLPDAPDNEVHEMWSQLGAGATYQLIVEPFADEVPSTASLRDDLEEIVAELGAGMALFDEKGDEWPAAALEWRMAFPGGWGRHLASLLYATHCAVALD
jgi:hypothetical protein